MDSSRRSKRDRSETMLRWIAAGLAMGAFALAAACARDEDIAERGNGSTEVIRVAGAPAPTEAPVPLPETSSPMLVAPTPVPEMPLALPEEPPVTYSRAEAVFREGRFGEAADLLARYAQREPTNPWGHYMLGIAAWKGGYLELAETHLVESVLIDPGHVKARVNLARVLVELGKSSAAEQHARIAEELDPGYVAAKRTLARALAEMGDHDGALAKYEEALWIDPEDRWSLNNMGYLLIQRGRHRDAIGPLALAVRLNSTSAIFQNNLGSALEGARLGRDVDTDALAQAYLEELRGCPGESQSSAARTPN